MTRAQHILLVEDSDSLREVLSAVLVSEGFTVTTVSTLTEAKSALTSSIFDCILSDFKLPDGDALTLLDDLRSRDQSTPFVMMTAFGTIDIAVAAMQRGATDFLTKPFDPDRLSATMQQVIKHRRIVDRSLGRSTRRGRTFLTNTPETMKLLEQAKRVAAVDSSVLILGESGTGKELLARYIHEHSALRDEPFVAVNCAALPAELLESEFFGHEAGAFTGATQTRIGVLELAKNGTLFLDEVGDMPPLLQVKLLRALQEKEIKRVGGTKTIHVQPRVISATNIDIEEALTSGKLREDFYFRLAVISFTLPPLRSRVADIEMLTNFFIRDFAQNLSREVPEVTPEALQLLKSYPWPGNSRELENVVERAMILAENSIEPRHLELKIPLRVDLIQEATQTLPEVAAKAVLQAEKKCIEHALGQVSGNKSKAARALGVSYKTLLSKIKEYQIEVSRDSA